MTSNDFKQFRRNSGYTQKRLASEVGCCQQYINQIENEGAKPSSEILTKMFALVIVEDILTNGMILK